MIDNTFSQLLTETTLEVFLGLYFMFSNTVIAFTLIKVKVELDIGSIVLLVLHFSQL